MGIVINPSSEYAKELRKWEQHHTRFALNEEGDSVPGHPYVYRPYPRMLYKAYKRPNGQYACVEGTPSPFLYPDAQSYERACFEVDQFNKSCQRIVQSEGEEAREKGQGWRNSPAEALELAEAREQEMAQAAAEANFAVQRMTGQAKQEWADAAEQTHEHVVDVVPKRKRGRPAKAKVAVTGTGPVEEN